MSTLSIYVGESQISALSFNSQTDFKFGFYPYVFPSELMKNDLNEEKFYAQVLRYLNKAFGIPASAGTVLIGTLGGVSTKIKGEVVPIAEALSTVQNYIWALVESSLVLSGKSWVSFYPTEKDLTFSQPVFVNYLSNKSLYPQIIPSSPDTFKAVDILTKSLVSTTDPIEATEQPLIFTGGRFTSLEQNPVETYLLALDLIRSPGIFNVKIDVANKLPVIGILNHHLVSNASEESSKKKKEAISFLSGDLLSVNSEEIFDEEFISLGTVLNAPGGVECLFEVEVGNSQFVELKGDRLFVFPLDKNASARIVADGKSVGHIEKNIRGGSVGLVIDTRDKSDVDFLTSTSTQHSDWVKVINERISAF